MKLYDYFRSSAGYRVRIALALKGLTAERSPLHLVKDGGQQRRPENLARNPAGLVPTLEVEGGTITQSLAIVEYLEEVFPDPPLLPAAPLLRAQVRAAALTVACDIHPLNNLRVLGYLEQRMGQEKAARDAWYRHWIAEGLGALEALLAPRPAGGPYAFGATPGLADLCLVPQLFNARRFDCPVEGYPTLLAIDAACNALPAFQVARPDRQSDAE
jgi:maleylacetoacetate isomerase